MARPRPTRRPPGFSLLELMMVMTIAGILAVAAAGLAQLLAAQRRWAAVAEIQRLVHFTRGEAVTRESAMTLCALDHRGLCQRQWGGREIAVFADGNRNRRLDPGEALLITSWPESRGRLVWRASLARPYLEYSAMGNTYQNGSFIWCLEEGDERADLVISINRGGRPYVGRHEGRRCR